MTPVVKNIQYSQVNQSYIFRFRRMDQICDQMENRRILGIEFPIRKCPVVLPVIEQGIRLMDCFIFFIQTALIQPLKESRINPVDCIRKQQTQISVPQFLSGQSPSGRPIGTPCRCCLRFIKEPCSP